MECSASIGGLHRAHPMTKRASAGISCLRIGVTSKQTAVKRVKSIRASQSQYASCSLSLYEVLSVPQNVSQRDIKSAYRRMALKYHPDVCPAAEKEECASKFLKVQEAYDTLSDPLLRQDYDWTLQNSLGLSEGRLEGSNVWEAQLMELIRKRSGYNSWSWGSTMRSRNQHAAAAAAATGS